MSGTTIYNSHGITIERFECKLTCTTGSRSTHKSIRVKAGPTVLAEVTEALRDGTTKPLRGSVLLSGTWVVRQSLDELTPTPTKVTTDALPPAYSLSSAGPDEATVRVSDYTVDHTGDLVSVFEKRISISASQTPGAKLILMLVLAADVDVVSPKPGCPVLRPGWNRTILVDGSWDIRQRVTTTPPTVKAATTPNVFRRLSVRIKTLVGGGASKKPEEEVKEKEKEAGGGTWKLPKEKEKE